MAPARLATMAGVAAGIVVLGATVLAATGGPPPPPDPPRPAPVAPLPAQPLRTFTTWTDRSRGLAVRYPARWSLSEGSDVFGQPTLCFELSTERRDWEPGFLESHVEAGGVEIRVAEAFGGRALRHPPRRRIRLDDLAPPGAVEWTKGGLYVFREHGRWIYVGVLVGPEASEETRRAAEDAVNSLRAARSGRCGEARVEWRRSRAVGLPYAGRLVGGVQLPAEGRHFFTWDPVLRRSPNRAWRRWGTDGVVRTTLRIVNSFARDHPRAARLGIGDLSRRHGGDFGPKHSSHQNGLDVDVYYPRLDRKERPPRRPAQVDRRLAQDLVDRFVAAGAVRVFVGPSLGLRGPRGVVQPLWNHDNHLHARFPKRRA